MEEISRFYRQVKQVKIGADCTCPYSPYGHVEGRTIMLTWQRGDVVHLDLMVFGEYGVDTWHYGSIMCGHVAQPFGAMCHYIIGSFIV